MKLKARIIRAYKPNRWYVVEGADIYSGGGKVISISESFDHAKRIALQRKENVGENVPIQINKVLYFTRLEKVV